MSKRTGKLPLCVADLVGLGVAGGVTALVAFGVVVPTTLRDRAAAAEAQAAARTRQRAGAAAVAIRAAETDLSRIRARLAAAPLTIRPASALNERLAALVALAGECGLGVSDFKPDEAVRGPKFLVTPVRLAGTGRFPDVARFLHRLPGRLPDVAVTGFRVQGGGETGGAGQYVIEVRWYASPGDAAPAVAPVSAPQAQAAVP